MRSLHWVGLLVAASLAIAGGSARAQSDYPNKPIRIVVGFTPGSVADITARVLGNRMGQILGQSVVVENRPGAGSNLAAEFVARSAKDATRCSCRGPPTSPTPRSIPTCRSTSSRISRRSRWSARRR